LGRPRYNGWPWVVPALFVENLEKYFTPVSSGWRVLFQPHAGAGSTFALNVYPELFTPAGVKAIGLR